MIGPRLFRSRRAALIWAAGIVWTAYDVAGSAPAGHPTRASAPTDVTGETIDPADLVAIVNAAG